MHSRGQRRRLVLDEIYVFSLVARAYGESYAKPYSDGVLRHRYSKRLLEVGSDLGLQNEVLTYLILYDELHFPGFDNFVLLGRDKKPLYPEPPDKDKASLRFDVEQYIKMLPSLLTLLESCCKGDEDDCNAILSSIREESEQLKRNPALCLLTYISMCSLNEIGLEYNEFKTDYCETCAELYTKIMELLQNLDCDKLMDKARSLRESCIGARMPSDLAEEIIANIECVPLVFNAIEKELPKDVVIAYNRCGKVYHYKSRILSFVDKAVKEELDIKIGSLKKSKSKLHRIDRRELDYLRTLVREEHADEAHIHVLAPIVFDKIPWIKPVRYEYALELLEKESISDFREWFWSNIDELLLTDSSEKASRIIREIEGGVNEILNAKDLKNRLEKYSRITLMLSLPLSFVSMLIPSASVIGLGINLLSITPEVIWYIKKSNIKRKYSWLMPDAII